MRSMRSGLVLFIIGFVAQVITVGQVNAATFNPVVSISPTSGPAGSTITVIGSGWSPNKVLAVESTQPEYQAQATTSPSGAFSTRLTIPSSAVPGPDVIQVSEGCPAREGCNFYYNVQVTFTVTSGITAPSNSDQQPVDPGPDAFKGCFLGATVNCSGSGSTQSPSSGSSATLKPPAASQPLGGTWVKPSEDSAAVDDGGSTFIGGKLHIAAHAYGGNGVKQVTFTALLPNTTVWKTLCPVSAPAHDDVYVCDWPANDLQPGNMLVSFDVYDTRGLPAKQSPNGIHTIHIMQQGSPGGGLLPNTNQNCLTNPAVNCNGNTAQPVSSTQPTQQISSGTSQGPATIKIALNFDPAAGAVAIDGERVLKVTLSQGGAATGGLIFRNIGDTVTGPFATGDTGVFTTTFDSTNMPGSSGTLSLSALIGSGSGTYTTYSMPYTVAQEDGVFSMQLTQQGADRFNFARDLQLFTPNLGDPSNYVGNFKGVDVGSYLSALQLFWGIFQQATTYLPAAGDVLNMGYYDYTPSTSAVPVLYRAAFTITRAGNPVYEESYWATDRAMLPSLVQVS